MFSSSLLQIVEPIMHGLHLPDATLTRVVGGLLELNIEYTPAAPQLSGQLVSGGTPITTLPQGCLSEN